MSLSAEQISSLRAQHYNATVAAITLAHDELMRLRVATDFRVMPHRPGQYCTLGLGTWEPVVAGTAPETRTPGDETKLIRRAYSLSHPLLDSQGNLPTAAYDHELEFYIVLLRDTGTAEPPRLTPRLFNLKVGDRLAVGEKISGHYTLDGVKPTDTVVFLATGTGEAPHNYMLYELLRQNHPGSIASVTCSRFRKDFAYVKEHLELMRRFPNYRYIPLTTREDLVQGRKVYIQDFVESGQLEERIGHKLVPSETHVFMCGNPKMIGVPTTDSAAGALKFPQPKGVIEVLVSRGFTLAQPRAKVVGNLHFEEYW